MQFKSENEQDKWINVVMQMLDSGIYVVKEAVDRADQLMELYQERSVNLETKFRVSPGLIGGDRKG